MVAGGKVPSCLCSRIASVSPASTISGVPSPFRSATATETGLLAAGYVVGAPTVPSPAPGLTGRGGGPAVIVIADHEVGDSVAVHVARGNRSWTATTGIGGRQGEVGRGAEPLGQGRLVDRCGKDLMDPVAVIRPEWMGDA